jgi:GNAT superfamily N-acetyltransferase
MTELTIRDLRQDDDFAAWLNELLEVETPDRATDRRYLSLSNEIGDWIGGLRWVLHGGVATLEDLIVVPDARQQGHAERLLEAFEARAIEAEAHLLECWTDSTRAEDRMARRGWQAVTRRPDYIGHKPWTLLEKRVTA